MDACPSVDSSKLHALSAACVMEVFEDDVEEEPDVAPVPKSNPDIEAVDENVRSGAARLHEERLSWLLSLVRLIAMIQSAASPVFQDTFSGRAGLTRELLRQEWPCGSPIDILYNADFDVLNSLFFAIMLGLISKRLIRALNLGLPCSSFSMAVNRFKPYAMRSAREPGGLCDLPPHREEKARLRNALAEISRRLADAQERAGNFWTLEQPATSLMRLSELIAALIGFDHIYVVTTDVCV